MSHSAIFIHLPVSELENYMIAPDIPLSDLRGRTAIVTGANAGLGFQTALQLAQRGARIILACRSQERARTAMRLLQEAVPTAALEVALLDVGNLDSVKTFVDDCHRRLPKLDLLCNNAGVIGIPYAHNPNGFEMHMATNFFGPFALVGQLLDLLQATPGARIVNISSQAHRLGKLPLDDLNWEQRRYKHTSAYAQSKLAIASYTLELDRRLREQSPSVMALIAHPGFSKTDAPPTGWVSRVAGTPLTWLANRSGLVQDAAEGARCSLYALTSPEARGGDYIGPENWLGSRGAPARALASVTARDTTLAGSLWAQASEATGIHYLDC